MNDCDLSVIVPAYNEKDNIEPLIKQVIAVLEPLKKSYEILFVDDGSSDGTTDILLQAARNIPVVRVIRFVCNHGQSAALAAGFQHARGKIFIMMDADLQNDPADIPNMLAQLKQYDAVCGWRFDRQDTFVKRISSRIANGVRNWATQETIHDTGCSLKVFKSECVQNMQMYDGLHRFIPTLIKMHGYTVGEMKVNHRQRIKGLSKYNISNRLFHSLYDLIAVRWMQKRQLHYQKDIRI